MKQLAKRPMIDHIHALQAGYQLQEYTITGTLGFGGFGITYSAHDNNLDKIIAIKEYLPSELAVRIDGSTVSAKSRQDQGSFDWGLERFLDEARTLAKFDHPHIVNVHRFFEQNGTGYIVMELVEGRTLASVLKEKGTLEESEIRIWLWPIMEGLSIVHAAGYLHRDVKPQNIMMQHDGRPCLLDFGAARLAIGGRTRSLTAIMTPGFAPLEQYQSKGQGPWTDIYALGAVMYKCISGNKPLTALDRLTDDSMPAPEAKSDKTYSPGLLKGIHAALEVKASDRPQNLQAWLQQLDNTDDETTRKTPDTLVSPTSPHLPETESQTRTVESPAEALGRHDQAGSWKRWQLAIPLLLLVVAAAYWFVVRKPEPGVLTPPAITLSPEVQAPAEPTETDAEKSLEQTLEQTLAEQALPEEKPNQGLNINIEPSGADIFIDDAFAGNSPLEITGLTSGQEISVRVEAEGFDAREQVVRVPSGQFLELDWVLEEAIERYPLTVKTAPLDATVRILNITPDYQHELMLEPGKYQLEVSAVDYETRVEWIELKDSAVISNIELARTKQWLQDQYLNERDREERERAENNQQNALSDCEQRCLSSVQSCINSVPRCNTDGADECFTSAAASLTCGGNAACLQNATQWASDCQQQTGLVNSQCLSDRNLALTRCETRSVTVCRQSCR